MNEELKIIISAVTDKARKNIEGVKKELGGLQKEGEKSGKGLGTAFKAVGIAAGAAVAAVGAVVTALVALGNNTKQFRAEQAKLNTAFLAAGSSAQQAGKTYSDLFRFLGDSGKATEAGAHLAKLTTNEKELAEWTTALQGVYATFGDSLPIEGLTEAANETAKVGTVTGVMADALNWAGVSEDMFNAQLAATNSESERQALIRNTLNGLYSDAAQLYEKNNAELIAANEAQARLDMTTASLGKTVQPLLTALTNFSNVLLTALAPAIQVVSGALTYMINAISKAIGWLSKFFGILSGKGADTGAIAGVADSVGGISTGLGGASTGANKLGSGLGAATKQAEKLKKVTAGFDELNILSSGSSSSSGSDGAAAAGAGALSSAPIGGVAIDTSGVTGALDETSGKIDGFAEKVKNAFNKLKTVFAPTIGAFKELGAQIGAAISNSLPNFNAGLEGFKNGFNGIFTYLIAEFIPNVVNAWSTTFLPIFGDISSFAIEDLGKSFERLGSLFNSVSNDIIQPALQTLETVVTDIFDSIKKAWDKSGGALLTNLGIFFDGVREDVNEFYNEVILPIWEKLQKVFDKVWTEGLKPLIDEVVAFGVEVGACLLQLYNGFIKPIVDWLQDKIYPIIVKVINKVIDDVGKVVTTVSQVIAGVIQAVKGIIQFITGVFTGDWKKAWEGVKNIFGGIFDSLVAVIKAPLNLIIGAINSLISGIVKGVNTAIKAINKLSFTVPDWVPELGGKKFGFNIKEMVAPTIPKLATGGLVMSETLARIGEGGKKEVVLPLEQNTQWADILTDKLAAKINTPSKIVLMVNETELGWANINSINGITKQTGQIQLTMV